MKRIAILVAVAQELGPVARRLDARSPAPAGLYSARASTGTRAAIDILVAATGVGSRRSGRAAASILQVWRPDLIVMAGVAGALSNRLSVADVVVANSVCSPAETRAAQGIPQAPSYRGPSPVHTGAILSLDHVLVTAADKRSAADAHPDPPIAVEMETFGVIRAAELQRIPWAAVRAVSDTAEEALPLDFNRLRSSDGDLPTARVAMAAIARPSVIPGLIRLGKNTSLAAEAVAGFLAAWLEDGAALA